MANNQFHLNLENENDVKTINEHLFNDTSEEDNQNPSIDKDSDPEGEYHVSESERNYDSEQ